MSIDDVRRTAVRSQADVGTHLVSCYATLDQELPALCRHRNLFRYSRVRTSNFAGLRAAGFALLPSNARPHFDILLPDVSDATLQRLVACFDPPIPNPARFRVT